MKRRARFAIIPAAPDRRAFTLLELCIVLLIIAILMGAMMPALHSAFVESALRDDARQLSFLVRSAMLQSSEQHENYVLDLDATGLNLHPASAKSAAAGAQYQFDPEDKLLIPDPQKKAAWIHLPATTWIFQPSELCPATRVRMTRGNAWVEMSFNALTGSVEDEAAYFP